MNVQLDENGDSMLCLHLTQRSADVAIGVPYNIAGYALILELLSHLTGIKPGIFAHSLVDAHVYTAKPDGSQSEFDHIPGLRQQLKRTPRKLPNLTIDSAIQSLEDVNHILNASLDEILDAFKLTGYQPHEPIKFQVAV